MMWLRIRRGLVLWPRVCVDCGRRHLNGRRVSLPLCVSCASRALTEERDDGR